MEYLFGHAAGFLLRERLKCNLIEMVHAPELILEVGNRVLACDLIISIGKQDNKWILDQPISQRGKDLLARMGRRLQVIKDAQRGRSRWLRRSVLRDQIFA